MSIDLRLRAVEGWIELGNFSEAADELHGFPPELKNSVEFVRLWVRIYAATDAWTNVEIMCETLLRREPDDFFALFYQADAFHRQGRSREAFTVFQYAPLGFKHGPQYFYSLARYLCALDQTTLALSCLGKAFDADPTLRAKALNDSDLKGVAVDLLED